MDINRFDDDVHTKSYLNDEKERVFGLGLWQELPPAAQEIYWFIINQLQGGFLTKKGDGRSFDESGEVLFENERELYLKKLKTLEEVWPVFYKKVFIQAEKILVERLRHVFSQNPSIEDLEEFFEKNSYGEHLLFYATNKVVKDSLADESLIPRDRLEEYKNRHFYYDHIQGKDIPDEVREEMVVCVKLIGGISQRFLMK